MQHAGGPPLGGVSQAASLEATSEAPPFVATGLASLPSKRVYHPRDSSSLLVHKSTPLPTKQPIEDDWVSGYWIVNMPSK